MPLASTFVLSKKRGNEAWIEPEFDYVRKKISYKVKHGEGTPPEAPKIARGAKFKKFHKIFTIVQWVYHPAAVSLAQLRRF